MPQYCRDCDFLGSCNGGCPKDRLARTPDGEDGLNYLCDGFKRFFSHTKPYLQKMADLSRSGASKEQIWRLVRDEDAKVSRQVGRNDPCPCGSAKKYKKCCLGKSSFDAGLSA